MFEFLSIHSTIVIPFLASLVATVILTPASLSLIKRFNLIDDPKTHKHPAIIHKKPIPRGGGIPFFLGILFVSLFFLPLNGTTIAIFTAGCIALITGVVDDKYDISRYIRFLINIVCAAIVVFSGVTIEFITSPFGGIYYFDPIVSTILSVVWIVWVMNMLNWSKGVDGQMPGIVAISALVIGILSLRFPIAELQTLTAAKLSFVIAGASLGFLVFNFYPAKIFPGYGATSVYLLLSVVSILSGAKLATAILVMGIPMVDGVFTILRRLRERKSPFLHDNKHLHHLLLRLGFGQRRIALFYWAISAILGGLSLALESRGKLFAIIMLATVAGGALLFLHLAMRDTDEKLAFNTLRLLRPRQWIKNFAVFAAITFAGELFNPLYLDKVLVAFFVFCALSSAIYIINDFFDREKDKLHPFKKFRPLAAGSVPVSFALFLSLVLTVGSLAVSLTVTPAFFLSMIGFLVLQVSYSMLLKHIAVIDILALASGYILRVYAGAFAAGSHISVWLLLTTISLSLFLAIGKRRSELTLVSKQPQSQVALIRKSLSHYSERLLDVYASMFATSTFISYTLFTFLENPSGVRISLDLFLPEFLPGFFQRKWLMITILPVVYGLMRYMQDIYEKHEGESPERVLLGDKPLIITVVIWIVMVLLIVYVVGA